MKPTRLHVARIAVLLVVASTSTLPQPCLAGENHWNPIVIPSGFGITCPVTHSRITDAPVRVDRLDFAFPPGSRGRLTVAQLGVRNDTDCVAHKIWLYWRLYRETDLDTPVYESMDVATQLRDIDSVISPSVSVKWVFPCDSSGTLLIEPGVTYRVEFGVSRIEWSDGTAWMLGQESTCPLGHAT